MRTLVATAVACSILVSLSQAQSSEASIRKPVSIEAQQLSSALQEFAQDRKLYLIYAQGDVGGIKTSGISGEMTTDEALRALLSGTELTYKFLDEKTVTIVPMATAPAPAPSIKGKDDTAAVHPQDQKSRGFWDRFRLAQADTAPSSGKEEEGVKLEEIVVTAQKREERLLDVPVPVATIGGAALVSSNQLRLQDYFNRLPALTVTPGAQAANYVVIRGVTTGVGNPTVGILVDDTPYGSVAELGGGLAAPDIDPNDLARVEVLRGPQGTLYGASSLGGLLKFVTVDPSTDGFTGRVSAGTTSVKNGDGLGYNVRGAVNVPVSDSFAVRASGFTRHDPGYIDNPTLGIDGVNEAKATGGRLAALWKPSDIFSLKLSALRQKLEGDGYSQSRLQPGFGKLEQDNLLTGGAYEREAEAYSANMVVRMGSAELTSVSGYTKNAFTEVQDFHRFFFAPVVAPNDNQMHRFTQELRLAAPLGERWDLLLGGFYTDEHSRWLIDFNSIDAASGDTTGQLFGFGIRTGYREFAGFANLTAHVTERFDVQFGGRQGDIKQTFVQTSTFAPVAVTERAKSTPFTYLVTPQFKLSPNLMAYARFASGYRVGGVNNNSAVVGYPAQYSPDKTQNYEIGLKGDFLDGALFVDASAYYIDWKNVQVQIALPSTPFTYRANVGRAKSQGVELSVDSRPVAGWRVGGWVAWNDAVLTEDFPPGPSVGLDGDRLPYASRFSGNLSVDKEFKLTPDLSGFLGTSLSYIGSRRGSFVGPPFITRTRFPGYAKIDLTAGVVRDSWRASLFVNNVADRRGVSSANEDPFNLGQFDIEYVQPRTIGLSIAKNFGL